MPPQMLVLSRIWLASSLAVLLGCAGVSRMVAPAENGLLVGEVARLAGLAEVVLAVCVMRRSSQRFACWIVLLLASAGVAVALIGSGQPCGCLGRTVVLARADHLMLAGAMGLLACLLIFVGVKSEALRVRTAAQ